MKLEQKNWYLFNSGLKPQKKLVVLRRGNKYYSLDKKEKEIFNLPANSDNVILYNDYNRIDTQNFNIN